MVDGATALAMEPALVGPVAGGVLLPDDRSLDPVRALDALIARVASAGVSLRPFHELIDLDTSGRRVVRLRTTAGDLAADEVVLAAGAWTGRVARLLGTRVPVIAARGLSLTVERPDLGPTRPLLLGEDHVAVGPTADTLRLSAWFQLNRYDLSVPADRIARLERMARGRLRLDPTLTVRRRWAGLRPVTPDGVPIIGRLPGWDNVTIATGHSMTGLTHGPGTGRLVAQLVSGEHRRDRSAPLRPREVPMTDALTIDGARRVRVVDSHTGGEPTRVVIGRVPRPRGRDARRARRRRGRAPPPARHRDRRRAARQRGDGRGAAHRRRPTPRASPA